MNYNLSLKDSVVDGLLLWLNDNYEKIITTDGLVQQTGTSTTAAMSQKAVTDALATKQDQLTFDPSPVSGSLNPVTSGGIFSAIESAKGAAGLAEALLDTDSAGAEQEFSLRKSGGDGGAYFRRLLGNTKAFNQLVENGNFADISGWTSSQAGVMLEAVNNACKITFSATPSAAVSITHSFSSWVIGHKYLFWAEILSTEATHARFLYNLFGSNFTPTFAIPANAKTRIALIGEITGIPSNNILIYVNTGGELTAAAEVRVSDFDCIDLTAMQDNSATPEEFREKYPLLYYAYGRKLIHNKVAKVITKGANQWDEVWELGGINSSGVDTPANDRIRSKNYIPVFPSTPYYFKTRAGLSQGDVFYYDANKNFISGQYSRGNSTFTTPANCAFIRIAPTTTYGSTYANDICINLSDADINGQYFPYWERELALDITNQEDTDGNKPFAEGVKSCPVASDEFNEVGGIVRVGVRPYQASDDTDASVITDGVDTAYALTTPVPFTWKEPLNTGIKVSKYGTEEITPAQTENIDNAPFRAVATYSISVANLLAALSALGNRGGAKGSLGGGNPNPPENEELTPEEESPKEEENPKEEETPVVEPVAQSKK